MRTRTAGVILATATVAIVSSTEAQERRGARTTSSSVLVARSSGVPRDANEPDEREQPRRAGRPLTPTQLGQLLAPLGFALSDQAGPWRLDVAQRRAGGGRFRLSFWNIENLVSTDNETRMPSLNSRVYLKLRALAPNESYLIQCVMTSPDNPNPRFHLFGPDGSHSMTTGNYVVGVYHAPDTKDATFYMMPTAQTYEWRFSHCDISTLAPAQTPR